MAIENESTIDPAFVPKHSRPAPRQSSNYDEANKYNGPRRGDWKITSGESSYVDGGHARATREAPRTADNDGIRQNPVPRELLQKLLHRSATRQAEEDEAARKANLESIAPPRDRRHSGVVRPTARDESPRPRVLTMPKHLPPSDDREETDKGKKPVAEKFDAPTKLAGYGNKPPSGGDTIPAIIRSKDGRELRVNIPARLRKEGTNPHAVPEQVQEPATVRKTAEVLAPRSVRKGSRPPAVTEQPTQHGKREESRPAVSREQFAALKQHVEARRQEENKEAAPQATQQVKEAPAQNKKERRQQAKQAKKEAKKGQGGNKPEEKRTEHVPMMSGALGSRQPSLAGSGRAHESARKPSSHVSAKTDEHNFAGFGRNLNDSQLRGGSGRPSQQAPAAGWGTNNVESRHSSRRDSERSFPVNRSYANRDLAAPPGSARNEASRSLHASDIERALRRSRASSGAKDTVFAGHGWISPHPLSAAPTQYASPPESAIRGSAVNMSYPQFLTEKVGTPRHSEVGKPAVGNGGSVRSKQSDGRVFSNDSKNYHRATVESEHASKASGRSQAKAADQVPAWDMGDMWAEAPKPSSRHGSARGAQDWNKATGSWNTVPQLDGHRSFEDVPAQSPVTDVPTDNTFARVRRAREYITAEAVRMDKEHELLSPKKQAGKNEKYARGGNDQFTTPLISSGHRRGASSALSTTAVPSAYTKRNPCSRHGCDKEKIAMTSFDRMQEFQKRKASEELEKDSDHGITTPTPGPRKYVRHSRAPPMLTPEASFDSKATVEDGVMDISFDSDATIEGPMMPTPYDIEESKRRLGALDSPASIRSASTCEYTIPARTVRAESTIDGDDTPSPASKAREAPKPTASELSDAESGCTPTGFIFTQSLHDSDLHETDIRPGRENPAYNMEGFTLRTAEHEAPMSECAPSTVMDEDAYWARRSRETDPATVRWEKIEKHYKEKKERKAREAAVAEQERIMREADERRRYKEYEQQRRYAQEEQLRYAHEQEEQRRYAAQQQRRHSDEGYSGSPLFMDAFGNYKDAQGNFMGNRYEQQQGHCGYDGHREKPQAQSFGGYGYDGHREQRQAQSFGGFANGSMCYVQTDQYEERDMRQAQDGHYGYGRHGDQGTRQHAAHGYREYQEQSAPRYGHKYPIPEKHAGYAYGGGLASGKMYTAKVGSFEEQGAYRGRDVRNEQYGQQYYGHQARDGYGGRGYGCQ